MTWPDCFMDCVTVCGIFSYHCFLLFISVQLFILMVYVTVRWLLSIFEHALNLSIFIISFIMALTHDETGLSLNARIKS